VECPGFMAVYISRREIFLENNYAKFSSDRSKDLEVSRDIQRQIFYYIYVYICNICYIYMCNICNI